MNNSKYAPFSPKYEVFEKAYEKPKPPGQVKDQRTLTWLLAKPDIPVSPWARKFAGETIAGGKNAAGIAHHGNAD